MKYNKESILKQYDESGNIMLKATLEGDFKSNNREGKKLVKYFRLFEKDRELAKDCIVEMLNSPNVVVRTKAAAYCLALDIDTEIAVKELEKISANNDNGIFAFNAKMTLEVWLKQGYLRIY